MSNVSSVDLDELRKAREELNQEIGVENDPNMYKDYNPNREEEKKKEPEIEPVVEEQTSKEPVSENLDSNEENATSELPTKGEFQRSLNEPREYSEDKKELTWLDKITILFRNIFG